MIYIWDNGGEYSDHAVHFIKSDLPWEEVERVLGARRYSCGEGHLVGRSETIDWRDSVPDSLGDTISLHDFLGDVRVRVDIGPDPGITEDCHYGKRPNWLHPLMQEYSQRKNAAEREAALAKAKYFWEYKSYRYPVEPTDRAFACLSTASALELLRDWKWTDGHRHYHAEEQLIGLRQAFIAECRERGLL